MHTKKNAAFLINVVLSMLILAYITFVTVYEQILTQNNGFFNVIVYGVVLILVFIFITLFIRILSFKNNAEVSPVLNVLKAIGILALFALFVYVRLRYTSSISPSESELYNTAKYISSGQLAEAKDVHSHIVSHPADYIYGFILSDVFAITGVEESIYIIVNIFMMLIAALFVFLTVKLIAGKACATLALIIVLFTPNNGYLVYSYNSELFVVAVFMMALYLYEVLIYKRFKKSSGAMIIALLCGLAGGFTLGSEPVIIFAFIILTIWVFSARRQSRLCSILPVLISTVFALILQVIKAFMMGIGVADSLKGYALCFVPSNAREEGLAEPDISGLFTSVTNRLNNPSRFLDDNSYFLSKTDGSVISSDQSLWLNVLNQFVYLFVLILCVLCLVYVIRVTYDKILPLYSVFIALFFGQVLGGVNNVCYVYVIFTAVIIGSTTLYYMYFNHHPSDAVEITNEEIRKENMFISGTDSFDSEETEEKETEEYLNYILRARALVFVGENDALYNQIKLEEKQNRNDSGIAATIIRTEINDEGEYDSVKQEIEYFDEPDKKVKVKKVPEVIAIPATRPVEVVKPVLADEVEISVNMEQSENRETASEAKAFNQTASNKTITNQIVSNQTASQQPEGFVFRKKNSSKEIKPGEPLPNPLKGPAPSNKKPVDFDFDTNNNDDFDF